ncbi:xanthine dehydrogenase family protein molybdopterin-binding subunit [Paradesulfitobacterium ferrireducens]|uniref:xanthine dehydrogenase family protein molybdopterin-binding subunit n=1 Tax=Paradesulfitobacterium ferrireducens TaxID=2816476 RepID=UPI001A8CE71B|nr:xanthine dehydrogenase family protein molybdopterin-binding subunit [Paradesulfitobacterium ferrireducens]
MLNSVTRIDALKKLTGQALYAADLRLPQMVTVKVLRAGIPAGKIGRLDLSKAVAVEGVLEILTAADIPGIPARPLERPVLCQDLVRYMGDGIALVIAENEKAAQDGLSQIRVEWEKVPAVFDVQEALAENAPLIHGDSNIASRYVVKEGSLEEAWQASDLILERTFRTSRVQAAPIEPEAVVANLETPDQIVVYCPCKSPFNVRRVVAETLGWDFNQIRIVQTVVGGSFGAKDSDIGILASRVALAALVTKRPARSVWEREESSLEGTKRHPYHFTYKIGLTQDGMINGMQIRGVADAGAYLSKTSMVLWRSTVEATGPYRVPAVDTELMAVYTNNPVSDAVRGFGSPQVNFAVELLLDEAAEKLGMDPLQLRRLNAFREGDKAPYGQVMVDVGIHQCLNTVAEASRWSAQADPAPDGHVRGRGMACCFRGSALGAGGEGIDAAAVNIMINRDGSVYLTTGISEVGQGSHTVFARLVQDAFAIPQAWIKVNAVDTSSAYDSGPTVASRGTSIGGNACLHAIKQLEEVLQEAAGRKLGLTREKIKFQAGRVEGQNQSLSWRELVDYCYQSGINLSSFGWYKAPDLSWERETGHGIPYFSYTYAAAVAEVDVDLITGEVKLLDYFAAHDVGNALNPAELHGQIGGGVSMGVGYALCEEVDKPERGMNFDRYIIPSAVDMGRLHPLLVETGDRRGPLGAKGIGEPATEIVAPAIINAISSALGIRLYELPAGLEQVKAAIERRGVHGNSDL